MPVIAQLSPSPSAQTPRMVPDGHPPQGGRARDDFFDIGWHCSREMDEAFFADPVDPPPTRAQPVARGQAVALWRDSVGRSQPAVGEALSITARALRPWLGRALNRMGDVCTFTGLAGMWLAMVWAPAGLVSGVAWLACAGAALYGAAYGVSPPSCEPRGGDTTSVEGNCRVL